MLKKLTLIVMYTCAHTSLYASYDSSHSLTPRTPGHNYITLALAFAQFCFTELEAALDASAESNTAFHEPTDELRLEQILQSHIVHQNTYTQVIPPNNTQPKQIASSSTTSSTRTSGFDLCEISEQHLGN